MAENSKKKVKEDKN